MTARATVNQVIGTKLLTQTDMASAVDHRIDEERKESLPLPTDAVTFENLYFALLGMAESFRTSNPPDIRRAIHCLEAIIVSNPPPRIEVRQQWGKE